MYDKVKHYFPPSLLSNSKILALLKTRLSQSENILSAAKLLIVLANEEAQRGDSIISAQLADVASKIIDDVVDQGIERISELD